MGIRIRPVSDYVMHSRRSLKKVRSVSWAGVLVS